MEADRMDACTVERRKLAKEFRRYQKVFTALGDETRQLIFIALLENETVGMRVPDITARTHLSRPAVSHHLRILKDAGLIQMHRTGTMNYYYVDANETCWSGLKELTEHVDRTVRQAAENQYPQEWKDER
jgi:DNA-binding transcriptional ArsR family regulator